MKRSLPQSLDQVGGMRAARWFRESTAGQWDNFGPDAQREQQDRAIARYGLADSALEWSVASSGWTSAWRTPTWEAMVASAQAGAFDVLVVGYVSRFLRNLKQTLIAVEDHLHAAGVVVLFADERLLSSDPSNWDQFVREAHEAEAYSRKLSKRVGEGYAAKRRRLGVPGGNRAPFGIIREGKPSTLRVDEAKVEIVRRAYELAAVGQTDWEVAAATDLAKTHVGELLTNPIYAGRLRTGEPAGIAPIVPPALWSKVQSMRELRRTRTPGRIVKRNYPLRLRCSGCRKFLYGDVGRYRHPAPTCAAFIAATPTVRRRYSTGHDKRVQGHSYPRNGTSTRSASSSKRWAASTITRSRRSSVGTTIVRPGATRSRWRGSGESAKRPVACSRRPETCPSGSERWPSSMPKSRPLASQSRLGVSRRRRS